MSYDISFNIRTGPESSVDIADRNYTSNVSGMWRLALGRSLGEYDGAPSSEAAGPLAAAVERMAANPDEYTPMNPDNGWGDYEGALDYLRWVAKTAAAHPATTIRVSR